MKRPSRLRAPNEMMTSRFRMDPIHLRNSIIHDHERIMMRSHLFTAAIVAVFLLPNIGFSQMGNVDTRYVSESSFLVLQFDVEKLVSYEKMGSKDIEDIAKGLKKHAGIDLMNLKTVTLQFGDGADPAQFDEDSFALVMNFSKAIDQDAFLEKQGVEFEGATFEGRKFHQAGVSYHPSIFFPDKKTIVMAKTVTLNSLMKKKEGDAPISALLNSATPGSEIIGAFQNTEAFATILAEIQQEMTVTPINLEKVYGEADSGFFQTQVKSSTPMFIQLNCKSEAAAKKIASKTKFLADFGKASIPLGRDALKMQAKQMDDFAGPNFPPEFKKAMVVRLELYNKALDLGDQILGATSASSDGKTARVKVKLMGGVRHVTTMLTKAIASQFKLFEEMQSPPLEGPAKDVEPVEKIEEADAIDR